MLPGYQYAGRKKVLWPVVPNSYPTYVAKGVGARRTYMLAHSGYRTADLRRVLDPDFAGDYFNARRLPKQTDTYAVDQEGLEKLRKGVIKYIEKSDLITLQIGANDSFQVIVILFEMLQENRQLREELQEAGAFDPDVTTTALKKIAQDNETLLRIIEMELASVQGFRNKDIAPKAFKDVGDERKRSAKTGRLIRKLRGHGLLSKVSRSSRHLVSKKGRVVISALVQVKETMYPMAVEQAKLMAAK